MEVLNMKQTTMT